MPSSFQQVNQSLRLDKGLWSFTAIAISIVLLAGWLAWAATARVKQYEVSDTARLEVAGAAYPVQANVSGRLVVSHLVLGKAVKAGDVLVELDSNAERLALDEEQAHLSSLARETGALRSQMGAEEQGRSSEQTVLTFSKNAARAQYQQAEAQALLAGQEAARAARLRADGLISQAEEERASADASSKLAAADSMKASIARLQPELQVRDRDRDVRLKQLFVDITKLDAETSVASVNCQRLEFELQKRKIRAPISGILSECAPVRSGTHISEGQQLGIILPDRQLQMVAEFEPASAFGKIRPGQNAIVRMEGFPWAQFGTLKARVARVAGEIRDSKVRVELAVDRAPQLRIPLQHGMPGSVEIEVGEASPAVLLLRSAGRVIGSR
jgi:membrane fusion protein (multidrug efflux system)